MSSAPEIVALVEQLFPIIGERFRVERRPGETLTCADDGDLSATLRMVVFDDTGAVNSVKEQTLVLLPAAHLDERGLAYLELAAKAARTLSPDVIEMLMPHDLFLTPMLDAPIGPEAFGRVVADERARAILHRRPTDAALLATLDPASRPVVPVLRNAELEAHIREHLDDPTAYAVYGDWLAERGDPRGELVALQILLATNDDTALARRAQQLIDEHAWEWFGDLAWPEPGDLELTWRYGFVSAIKFGDGGGETSRDSAFEMRELARLPGMAFVRSVEIGPKWAWDDGAFVAIGEVGLPVATRRFAIETGEYAHIGDLEPAYPGLARLEELRLQSRSVELGTVELPALRSLEIVTRGLTRENLESLREASWPALERLVLWISDEGVDNCDVQESDLDWILDGEGLPALKHLGLCGRANPRPLLDRLLWSKIVPRLEVLDLADCSFGADDLEHLRTHHAQLAHLRSLVLRPTGIVVGPNVVEDARFIPCYE